MNYKHYIDISGDKAFLMMENSGTDRTVYSDSITKMIKDSSRFTTFIKNIKERYESEIDSVEEVALYIEVYEEGTEVYVRDNEGGEWIMFNLEQEHIDEFLCKKIIRLMSNVYECPTEVKKDSATRRTQIEEY